MNNKAMLIITESMGIPLGNRKKKICQLKEMGYELKKNIKREEVIIDDIAFSFHMTKTCTQIVAHSHCKEPKKRDERYYFIYNYDSPDADILAVLNDFVLKAEKEIKKHDLEISDIEESLFLFKSLKNVITNNHIPHTETKLMEAVCKCFDEQKTVKLEAGGIEKPLYLLIELFNKYKIINFVVSFIDDPKFEQTGTIRVYINPNMGNDIRPAKQFEKNYIKWKKQEKQMPLEKAEFSKNGKKKDFSKSKYLSVALMLGLLVLGFWFISRPASDPLPTFESALSPNSKIDMLAKPVMEQTSENTKSLTIGETWDIVDYLPNTTILKIITPTPTPATTIPKEVIKTGLVAEYYFDGDAKDSSGNGNNGTIYGASFVDGKFGKGLLLSNDSDYVDAGDSPSINPKYITVEAWVKPQVDGLRVIVGKYLDGDKSYELTKAGDNRFYFLISTDGSNQPYCTGTTVASLNTFYHVAGTFDGSNIKIYVNGNLENTCSTTGNLFDNLISLKIGTTRKSNSYTWKGIIDEVRIYNRALNADEIKINHEASNALPFPSISTIITPALTPVTTIPSEAMQTGLIAEYNFDGDSKDSSGNRNDGTIYGASFVDGMSGKALRFDGKSNYFTIPGNIINVPTFTFSTWIRPEQYNTWIFGFGPRIGCSPSVEYLGIETDGRLKEFIGCSSSTYSSDIVPLNSWTHIAVVQDSSWKLYLYINGELKNVPIDIRGGQSVSHSNEITLGAVWWGGSLTGWFKGDIDSVDIYKTALSPEEIKELSGGVTKFAVREPSTVYVSIRGGAFDPLELNVVKGTTVKWENFDGEHAIYVDNIISPPFNTRESWSYTFNERGTFEYNSTKKPWVTHGHINVH